MQRWRSARGQAATEYVALVALVALALALAAGLTSGGVAGQVLAGLQRALCRVALAECPRPEPPRADLAACPVERDSSAEELTTTIAVVHLGTTGTLSAVRSSDGRVAVTLSHGNELGGEVGLGARLRIGGAAPSGEVTASAGVSWTSGRSWSFPNEAAAQRFVAAYGRKATIGGQLLDGARSRCSLLCDALGWDPHPELPPPDETFVEAGGIGALSASLGGVADAGADAGAVLGRSVRRDSGRTWHLQLSAAATAALDLPLQLTAGAGGEGVLSYELDTAGRPRSLSLALAGEVRGGASAHAGTLPVRAKLAGGAAVRVELQATLDLRDPENRVAAADVLEALTHPGTLPQLPQRARALGRRVHVGAQIDRRTYAAASGTTGLGAGLSAGAKVDAGFERRRSRAQLLSAETRLPGLPFLPRDDCRPGASASRRTPH